MPNNRRRLTGKVVSNKMDKTAVIEIEQTYRHPLYGKVLKKSQRYMAHDEQNACQIGDTVVIVESRPISRHKRWAVQEIVRQDVSEQQVRVDEVVSQEPITDSAAEGEA